MTASAARVPAIPVAGVAPVELTPETAGALATVQAWGEAFDARDLERMTALSTSDCELVNRNGTLRGHDGICRLLHLQSYGVGQHVHPLRYHARGSTVVVEARIELRWVESGELAETADGVAVFDVEDGRVRRFQPQPDLASAFRIAGWND